VLAWQFRRAVVLRARSAFRHGGVAAPVLVARTSAIGGVYRVVSDIGEAGAVTAESLWREHAGELLRFATVLVGPADAGDVVAETLLRADPALSSGRVLNPRAYLVRSVVNHALSLRRSRRRRWTRDLAAVRTATVDATESDIDVRRAVAALRVIERAVVYLAYWEDLTERDIAEQLQLAPSTVHRHLVNARARLRKALR
jgi:RNA polymerase sigma factor (sigma-70 family)